MNDIKNQRLRAKAIQSLGTPQERVVSLNNVLEVPFRADTSADWNVLTRWMLNELDKVGPRAAVEELTT
ncbi:hypothetical protein CCR75_008524 [Bremia lactucae]|uniref:Uncharacterized protein n=1 Tax=Bremia lactucae TaxID=4779 RepID=A0A976FHI6_BRELC|nr:hypothetical protein CCR75_008524 [Bremia lactucae]